MNRPRPSKRSISRQLVLMMLATVAALVAAIWLTVSYMLAQHSERQAKAEIVRVTSAVQQVVYWFVSGAYSVSRELASSPNIVSMDGAEQVPVLERAAGRNEYLELLYVQGTDGIQTARSDGGALGDRSQRFWFLRMMKERKPFVSRSYFSIATRMPCASVYVPMFREGAMVGVFGADIKLDYMQQLIERISARGDGRSSFILDGEGVIMAHPNEEYTSTLVNLKKRSRTVTKRDEEGRVVTDARGYEISVEEPYEISDEYADAVARVMAGESGTAEIIRYGKPHYMSYAPIKLPGDSESWSVITLQEKDAAMSLISVLLREILVIALVTAALAMLVFVVILRRKVLIPVRGLTDAAEKISRGELDTEIRVDKNAGDEISVMVAALDRMVEQLRVYIIKEAQLQAVTAVRLQFGLFVWEAASVPQAFKMTLAVLRYQYEPLRITAVYTTPNPAYSLTYSKDADGGESIVEGSGYGHHAEIAALLDCRRLVSLNAYAIKRQGLLFAEETTSAACVVPLGGEKLLGYIILESEERTGISIVKEESFLLETASELSSWLMTHRGASLEIAPLAPQQGRARPAVSDNGAAAGGESGGALAALRELDGLDVDAALETMGGLEDLYEKTIRLFVHILHDTLRKTDDYINSDMKAFAIEIHGIKGSLNNIGAELGQHAAWLEKAAKLNDAAYCAESYPKFRKALLDFHKRLSEALPEQAAADKNTGDAAALAAVLREAKEAADMFDAFKAKEILKTIAGYTYGDDTDRALCGISEALERFDSESASKLIGGLTEVL